MIGLEGTVHWIDMLAITQAFGEQIFQAEFAPTSYKIQGNYF